MDDCLGSFGDGVLFSVLFSLTNRLIVRAAPARHQLGILCLNDALFSCVFGISWGTWTCAALHGFCGETVAPWLPLIYVCVQLAPKLPDVHAVAVSTAYQAGKFAGLHLYTRIAAIFYLA